jgi:prolyl oligopeptidase
MISVFSGLDDCIKIMLFHFYRRFYEVHLVEPFIEKPIRTTIMKNLLLIITCVLASCTENKTPLDLPPIPETPVRVVTDTYFGKQINDPYRYLEDIKNPEVVQWFKDHATRSRKVLDNLSGRSELIEKMKEFDARKSTRVFDLNIVETNRYFYLKQTPDDENGKLYFRDGLDGEESLLFDPETYDTASGQNYVISAHYACPDGSKVAFEVSPNGSENSVMMIMEVDSKTLYPEKINRCWGSGCTWLPDNNSFLFNRLNSDDVHDMNREKNSKVYLHKVGQDAQQDVEFFSRSHNPDFDIKEEEIPIVYYDRDSEYLFGFSFSVDRRMKAWMAPISEFGKSNINWKKLFDLDDEVYNFTTTKNDIFIYTPKGAPNYKILKIAIDNPDLSSASVVVPEFPDKSIDDIRVSSDGLYFTTSKNGVDAGLHFVPAESSKVEDIELPFKAGSISLATRGVKFQDTWVSIRGWTRDNTRYRYDRSNNKFSVENLSSVAEYPEFGDLVVEELTVKSHDGAEVPLSLVYNSYMKKDGTNPVFIIGYGAYGYSMNPFFSPNMLLWTQAGGVFAVAHVRGGGEKGDAWYKGGHKTTKPNTWKDLIACADYLVNQNYTSPKKITINSASAGGILIGRAMTERPDLFAVAIPEVGVMNTLRAEESPNGPVNVPEFGTVKDSVECMALIEMDSYLHITDGVEYPATLITAGMNDPRVIAWEPAKFAARLTAVSGSANPVLFLTDFEAGHGLGDSKTKQFESLADIFSFALWQTGNEKFELTTLN